MGSSAHQKTRRNRRGVATVEFALVLPIIVISLLGVLEVGRMIEVEEILFNAASVGGRAASTGLNSATQVQTAVLNYLASAGLPTQNATVTVNDLTNPNTDPTAASTLDQLQVVVSIPFSNVNWSGTNMFVSKTAVLNATVTWASANANVYPSNITVPPGN